jgi:hypothetical protein
MNRRKPQMMYSDIPCTRPAWLDHPDFVPVDVTEPDLLFPDDRLIDLTRPELGASFGDEVDEVDEPYDHRPGVGGRRRPVQLAA